MKITTITILLLISHALGSGLSLTAASSSSANHLARSNSSSSIGLTIDSDEGEGADASDLFNHSSIGVEDGHEEDMIPRRKISTTHHPRVVEYNLTIGYFIASPDGVAVNVLGINGQVPSPTLEVTQGDTLVVNVMNEDPAHAHSLHWHGLSMKGSPEMDGVVGVTQCSLRPFKHMQYRFKVNDEPGTCKFVWI